LAREWRRDIERVRDDRRFVMRRLVGAFIGAWAVAGLAAAESAESAPRSPDGLQRVELVSGAGLVVRLLVREEASLADERWIGLELENRAERPLPIKDLYYDLDRAAYDPQTDRALNPGGMASGRPFPDNWQIGRASCRERV
jgi:hypothetical protein